MLNLFRQLPISVTLNISPVVYSWGMRIACLYLPSLPLQAFLRGAPQWIGSPVAISNGKIVACSRAAWAAGVRAGMSAPAAHELCAGLVAVPAGADRAAEK